MNDSERNHVNAAFKETADMLEFVSQAVRALIWWVLFIAAWLLILSLAVVKLYFDRWFI